MKKLIAAAVAAAVIVPASAMASATMYGKIHMGVAKMSGGETTMGSHSSRIGVKGKEKLGNGLTFGYKMEWGVSMDGDGSDLNLRNRYVTIGGGFGTVILGKKDTPLKVVGRKLDLFGERFGDTRHYKNGFDGRPNDLIAYVSPNMGGFTMSAGVILSEADGVDNAWSANGIYKNGPIMVAAGYTDASASKTDAFRIGGSYKIGAGKIVLTYSDYEKSGADSDATTIGYAHKFGMNTVKAQYTKYDAGSADGNLLAIGLEHKMSKRTLMYVDYGRLDNSETGTTFNKGTGNGYDRVGVDTDPTGFAVGLIHKF